MEDVVKELIKLGKTISIMESCTGGYIASCITNVSGSSEVFKFGAVTYSNLFKIKMGVSNEVIDKYSVYSMNTALEMAKAIIRFTDSDYGVGITGKLNREDVNNLSGEDNVVYISICSKYNSYGEIVRLDSGDRIYCKDVVLSKVISMIYEFIKKKL